MADRGDTGAPSNLNTYYDALLSTTLEASKDMMYDNIFKDSALLSYLRNFGGIDYQDGGERIRCPLMYGDNSTVKTHGGYSLIDTTPQEGITTAFYEWAEIAGSISISRKELRQNSGEAQLLDLLKSKIRQAEMTIREKLNTDLVLGTVSSSTFVQDTAEDGSYGVNPLGYFLRKDPGTDATTIDVGNISSASNSWWRGVSADASSGTTPTNGKFGINVTTYAGLKAALRRAYNYCSRGSGGAPDLVLFDQVSFETYENALDTQMRYTNTKMGEMGFDTLKLRGATCIWDEVTPDIESGTAAITKGTAFFVNTEFYRLIIDKETDLVTTPFIEPENQTAKTAKVLFMGNTTCSNLRKLGVLWGISQTIVS